MRALVSCATVLCAGLAVACSTASNDKGPGTTATEPVTTGETTAGTSSTTDTPTTGAASGTGTATGTTTRGTDTGEATTGGSSGGGSSSSGGETGPACVGCGPSFNGEDGELCEGSQAKLDDLFKCVCDTCADLCEATCTMGAPPSDACSTCQNDAFSNACVSQLQACLADD